MKDEDTDIIFFCEMTARTIYIISLSFAHFKLCGVCLELHYCLYLFEKYVGNGVCALRLIWSYFSDCTQRIQIDGILSDFASLLCGVPQGSVLGPMKFCLYLLPLGDT